MRKLFLLLVALLTTISLWAYDFNSGDLYYNITSNTFPYTAEVTYESLSNNYAYLTSVSIPSTVSYNGTTYYVTGIGERAFYLCTSLTDIDIPNDITYCGGGVFYGCSALRSVKLSENITSLPACYKSASRVYGFFGNCSSLTSVTIPSKVTHIGLFAFNGTGIYNDLANWENNVLYIGDCLIAAKPNLSGTYTIKNGTRLIAEIAFAQTPITSVIMPNTITHIGGGAFYRCSALQSVQLSENLTALPVGVYSNTRYGIFGECGSLISVVIPDNVTSIDNYTFYECSSLLSVTIPANANSIGDKAFYKCSSLASVVWNAKNCADFEYNEENMSSNSPFARNTTITSFIFGKDVNYIPAYLCFCMQEITSVTIPNNVKNIGEYAFAACIFARKNFINNSSLTAEAYSYWGATVVDEEIDGLLIQNDTLVICRPHVAVAAVPNNVISIGDFAFSGCSHLTSVTIPESVLSIESYAFANCDSLKHVTLSNGLKSIGDNAFSQCYSLETINIPNSVNRIGHIVFYQCISLKNLAIPNSVTEMGVGCFASCTALKSILLSKNITSIHELTFFACNSLESIDLPEGVNTIERCAFQWCDSLTKITIPSSVNNIGDSAFIGCSMLDTIYYYATAPANIDTSSFVNYNAVLYIPCESMSNYQSHEVWNRFDEIQCISSKRVDTDDVVVESGSTSVTITWPSENGADTYSIVIKKDGEVFCTLTFNSEGQLLNIAFAPGRNGNHPAQYAEQVANGKGYRFTVTGLEEGTHYTYNIDVKNTADQTINSHSGEFATQSTTAVENIEVSENDNAQKLLRNGQLIIVRDGVEYTVMGQEM